MHRSLLFRKLFGSIFVVMIVSSFTLYYLSVPMIKKTVYETEEASSKTILDNVYELIKAQNSAIVEYRKLALISYKKQLKNITLIQESYIKTLYDKVKQNKISEEKAKNEALEEMRTFRYGHADYVWVSDYDSVLISHPDPKLHKADFFKIKDINGNPIVPPMVSVAREKGEGYTSYFWQRLGEKKPIEKLTYSKDFSPWKWVIGTGLYIDDVKNEVTRRRFKMVSELQELLKRTKIARTGYIYIFDSQMNMIIHPNSNIEKTNFSDLLNPITKKSIGKELIAIANQSETGLLYKWDRPTDKNNYVYDKISWVKYYEPFDWYIASSVYLDELNISANMLRNRVLWTSVGMVVLLSFLSVLFLNKLLVPLQMLLKMTKRVEKGDLNAQYHVTGNDEISALANGFNRMVLELKSYFSELDKKVIERTKEAEEKNKQLQHEIDEHAMVSEQLENANEELHNWVTKLEIRNQEIAMLNQMGDMLQACRTMHETYSVIAETLSGVLPDEPGALYMLDSSKNLLEQVASWGNFQTDKEMFPPEECWGLRRGKTHLVKKPGPGQVCEHIHAQPPFDSLCLPMIGQGEVLGMLHLCFKDLEAKEERDTRLANIKQLAITITDHVSLALANIKLRERLQGLSVRDPLTNLYNRRYMKETLEREIKRAKRYSKSVSFMILDLDHFKLVNDTHGHNAGDKVLKSFGRFLEGSIRGEDIACRYGGEEFVLIMPGISLPDSEAKANQIRREVEKNIYWKHIAESLSITVSIGVASFPEHGDHAEKLITEVDAALYQAKKKGRNRVVVCHS